jgi:hypothetical protein
MRRNFERRRRDSKRKIMEIRTAMASTVMDDNKLGDQKKCVPTTPAETRNKYCNSIPDEKFETKKDCFNSPDDFCYSCCETEFGRLHEIPRK